MTNTTKNNHFEDALFDVLLPVFAEILKRDAVNAELFAKRTARFKVNGLLTFAEPAKIKAPEFTVDNDRLDDPRYRRMVVRKLKAPRPGKWTFHELRIDRIRIENDADYLNAMAKVLAYKWVQKITPVDCEVDALLLMKQNADTVTICLDKFAMHQTDGKTVAACVMRTFCEEALDKNETLNFHLNEIRRVAAEARANLVETMAPINKKLIEDFNARIAEINAQTAADADEYLAGLRARMAETADHAGEVLAESGYPNNDVEAEWREQLRKADEKRRAGRKKWWKLLHFFK